MGYSLHSMARRERFAVQLRSANGSIHSAFRCAPACIPANANWRAKVVGIAVHIGARVAATANPDEVMVSSTVRDLVAGSGLKFGDRGIHRLKGVPDEWRLFAVQ